MADYIPGADAEFNTWINNFLTYANANLEALGLSASQLEAIAANQSNWQTAYANHITARSAAESALQTKEMTRKTHETSVRTLVRQLQANPNMTDAQRAALGITLRQAMKTSVGVPTSQPLATIDASDRLRHIINFVDQDTPTRRAKPSGVMGCEIWVKVGSLPADPSELQFLGLDTQAPYTAQYQGADAGKTAYYMLRWVNRRGEPGPWSQTVSATIPG